MFVTKNCWVGHPAVLLHRSDQPRNIHPNEPRLVVVSTDQVLRIIRVYVKRDQHTTRIRELNVRSGIIGK